MRTECSGSGGGRRALAALLVLTAAAGWCTTVYSGPGAETVRGSLGGLFYVLFWCFLGFLLFPRARPGAVAFTVLAATCALEFAQLWHPRFLEAARGTRIGAILLGTCFDWADFPWYFAGCAAAYLMTKSGTLLVTYCNGR